MPKMDGLEATKRIMELSPVPIVIVSGTRDIGEVSVSFQALEAGALTAIQRPLGRELDAVLAELRRIIAAEFPIVADVTRHLLQMRGKMFRPTLLLLAARATGEVAPRDVRLAAVVELIHLATLVHDDSVDHSALRRGQPTINALFSHQIAVIMGDFLYSRAIIELVRVGDLDPLQVFARVTNEMTIGEMRQLARLLTDAITRRDDVKPRGHVIARIGNRGAFW